MLAVYLQVRMLHAPYVRTFEGFNRPRQHFEHVHVRELALGSGYIATGQAPGPGPRSLLRTRSRRTGARAVFRVL
jgi:hypothetical protein